MYLIDTHTHIFLEAFDGDIDGIIARAVEQNVKIFCLPNIDAGTVDRLHDLSDRYLGTCLPAMGLHPTSVREDFRTVLEGIRECFKKRKYIAVGETGIDLYWDKTFIEEQIEAFEIQLRWANDLDIPVIIHTREAFSYVFRSLSKAGSENLRGVFHSFGGSREDLETALGYSGFMIGINGAITFKNNALCEYLPIAPIDRIVVETDAPYLSPVPFRGKRNEPAYIIHTVRKLAEIYGITSEEVAAKTTVNAEKLFMIETFIKKP
ncbi:MAG: TatD family hydrolase [Dysgonamonadaceae bacterium]|jgi:TatD DNase family protein|nr:TatD family hydrolase [Dysgonamonadaceae bacterium]